MKTFRKFTALLALMALCAGQAHGQDFQEGAAYEDSENASYLSAALPIGALAVAAIIIATTNRHHHHSSSGGGGNSSSHIHAHSSDL